MAEIGQDIEKAKSILKSGGLVAIPTETVYGLAANALDPDAILKIYKAKNRPSFDPLISHTHSLSEVPKYTEEFTGVAHKIAQTFWPGPLTVLLRKKNTIPDILTSGLPRMAIRIPNHALTLELLSQLDFPLAAPSANPFGYVSPTRPEHVDAQLGEKVEYILDGGPCKVGIESTIISYEEDTTFVHRMGGLSIEQIERFGPVRMDLNRSSNPNAPGQLSSHYSPGKRLIIGNPDQIVAVHTDKRIGVISFQHKYEGAVNFILSEAGSIDEAAAHLFEALRDCDRPDIELVIAEQFPDEGLGRAINDRLLRAASTSTR